MRRFNAVVPNDRRGLGRALGELLRTRHLPGPFVLGVAQGGLVVADVVASALSAPLEVLVAQKLRMFGRPPIGAIAEDCGLCVHQDVQPPATAHELQAAITAALEHNLRQMTGLRDGRPLPQLDLRTAIIVDDCMISGATVRAALDVVKQLAPDRIVLAAGYAPRGVLETLEAVADEVVVYRPCVSAEQVVEEMSALPPVSVGEVFSLSRSLAPSGSLAR